MRIPHTPYYWIVVALVLAALLLALNEAHGQSSGAAAMFEGRPAMAGAQGGLGAQAGVPQGGIGVQGTQDAQRSVHLRRPSESTAAAQAGAGTPATEVAAAPPHKAARDVKVKPHDSGLASDQRSAVKKTQRAAKRSLRRSRTGVGEIDSSARNGG